MSMSMSLPLSTTSPLSLSKRRPLEAVFLTSFSVPCFQATPALAQMADDLELQLTLLHAFDPEKQRRKDAEAKLRSFFPEADAFPRCRRVVREGGVREAVDALAAEQSIDLILSMPSDPLWLPSIQPSRRAELLGRVGTLLWTAGSSVQPTKLRRRPRHIACWLDFDSEEACYLSALRVAAQYAAAVEAQLHLLYVLPDVLEGTLRPPSVPLHAGEVRDALREHLPGGLSKPEIHVSPGGFRPVPELLRRCDADLLVLGTEQAVVAGWLGSRMNPLISQAHCPVLCVGGQGARVPLARRNPARLQDALSA
jgi:nucleotide-binding universal stress UspA family protein